MSQRTQAAYDAWSISYDRDRNAHLVLEDFHQRFADYFAAIETAGLAIQRIKQLLVSETIHHLLTESAYHLVKGR